MNRRGFLSSLIASGLTAAIDPERLLWVPGARRIFTEVCALRKVHRM